MAAASHERVIDEFQHHFPQILLGNARELPRTAAFVSSRFNATQYGRRIASAAVLDVFTIHS